MISSLAKVPVKAICLCIASFLLIFGTPVVAAPEAAFSGTPTTGTVPLAVAFTDTSAGDPTGWAWFFGDESYGEVWTEVNANAGWSARSGHSSVALADGSILLMGGYDGTTRLNDTWRSTDGGASWTLVNASSGWTARLRHTSVALADGSILLMGGSDDADLRNDVWRSDDGGRTWTLVNASAGWSMREAHTAVVLPDGSVILMGGRCYGSMNDVWRSTDCGATWIRVNASAGWSKRVARTSVAMPDGSIILMGGYDSANLRNMNDTWRSTDCGATWTRVNESSGWSERDMHTAVAMPDGSIVLMGGSDNTELRNDVWRSCDYGATWTEVNPSAGWSGRAAHTAVAMPDGSILLMGGTGEDGTNRNDVWRLQPAGSSEQDPQHEYTASGTYSVTLQAFNADGCDSTQTTGYVTVLAAPPTAAFSGTPTSGIAPLTVTFTDTSTGEPSSLLWSFGDGETSTEQHPVHAYTTPGTYTVNLTVSNTAGTDTLSETGYVAVSAPTVVPKAAFSGAPVSGAAPLTVFFTDRSTDGPTGWAWFFGDEAYGEPWTLMSANAGWAARAGHSSVALADGSIVLMGGSDKTTTYRNDTWRSTDCGATWTLMNASSGWTGRAQSASVATPDGSIVLMGGFDDTYDFFRNDVWRSNDYGATWTCVNASAEWPERFFATGVVMPDGSILLMGGWGWSGTGPLNDTWRSDDRGATWTLVNASSGWAGRYGHAAVTTPDGSVVLTGGYDGTASRNDTWRSDDCGATWALVNASAGWTARQAHCSIVMPDGSIILAGGWDGNGRSDMWRSTDGGATWTLVNPDAGWTARHMHTGLAMPDGSILLMGGSSSGSLLNDTWRLQPAGSTEQNPTHTYTAPGNYTVTLAVDGGLATATEPDYISVTPVLFGDANEDEEVNQADTLVVLQEIVGLREKPDAGADRFKKTDVNANGAVDVGDALFIAQYNVGLRDPWFALL